MQQIGTEEQNNMAHEISFKIKEYKAQHDGDEKKQHTWKIIAVVTYSI